MPTACPVSAARTLRLGKESGLCGRPLCSPLEPLVFIQIGPLWSFLPASRPRGPVMGDSEAIPVLSRFWAGWLTAVTG